MTHRQFTAWILWKRWDKNQPSKTDWYLMQVAHTVHACGTIGSTPSLDRFKLKFGPQPPEPEGLTKEQVIKAHQADSICRTQTISRVTGKPLEVEYRTISRKEAFKIKEPA